MTGTGLLRLGCHISLFWPKAILQQNSQRQFLAPERIVSNAVPILPLDLNPESFAK